LNIFRIESKWKQLCTATTCLLNFHTTSNRFLTWLLYRCLQIARQRHVHRVRWG
jgi:hypothetical protein